MQNLDLLKVLFSIARANKYRVDFPFNLWGIRTLPGKVNSFDDRAVAWWGDKENNLNIRVWTITTDPGLPVLLSPIAGTTGAGILVEGQHIESWMPGLHHGTTDAWIQCKPLPVYRDNNKDAVMDRDPAKIFHDLEGCNLHPPKTEGERVDNRSQACQVWQHIAEHKEFMAISKPLVKRLTYTLITTDQLAPFL